MNPKITTYDKLNEKFTYQFIWTSKIDVNVEFYKAMENAYLFGMKDNLNIKTHIATEIDIELINL